MGGDVKVPITIRTPIPTIPKKREKPGTETVIPRMTDGGDNAAGLSEGPSCMGWMKSSEAQTLTHVNQLAAGTIATGRDLP